MTIPLTDKYNPPRALVKDHILFYVYIRYMANRHAQAPIKNLAEKNMLGLSTAMFPFIERYLTNATQLFRIPRIKFCKDINTFIDVVTVVTGYKNN